MSKLDEIKTSFADKLDAARQQHAARLKADLQELRARLLREFKPSIPADLGSRLGRLAVPSPAVKRPVQFQVDISTYDSLRQIDEAFFQAFHLSDYYSVSRLNYPTLYCETLEEFYTPIVSQMDLSPEARRGELQRLIEAAQEAARQNSGGILGYNLPGKGAYLNGWLFAFRQGLTPRQAFEHPEIFLHIMQTAAHEKLGHGFLNVYSALGEVKTRLGLTQAEIARKFGLRGADDPVSSLRREQANLLYLASQLLEEGWATWVETYLARTALGQGRHPRYTLQQVVEAVQSVTEQADACQALLGALALLFSAEAVPIEMLHQAVMIIEMLGGMLDEFLDEQLGQPLRYEVGELLFVQAEANLGAGCAPYAALIAANITFDPAAVSLADLRDLLSRDPRLNPDARLAALSRLKLDKKDDVRGMAKVAAAQLSFSVPKELQ